MAVALLVALATALAACAPPSPAQPPPPSPPAPAATSSTFDVHVLRTPAAVPTLDDEHVLSYELHMVSQGAEPARVVELRVADVAGRTLVDLSGAALDALTLKHTAAMKRIGEKEAFLSRGEGAVVRVDLHFPPTAQVPAALLHTFVLERSGSAATTETLTIPVDRTPAMILAPPVKGPSWYMDGAYAPTSYHRTAVMPIDGRFFGPERYAIDFEIIDDKGNLVEGEVSDNTKWHGWGRPLYAVADGEVVTVVDDKPQQTPPIFPKDTTADNAAGNHVVLKLAEGVYALYAHMQTHGIAVKVGAHLKKGDLVGHLGNSGNSTAPHLHFHLMDGPDPLRSQGVPFVFDAMIDRGVAKEVDLLHGRLSWDPSATRTPRSNRLPSLGHVVDFAQ
jgi:hypothetical protein